MKGLSPGALERLMGYSWPGNVRELRNTLERATLLAEGELIQVEDLAIHLQAPVESRPVGEGSEKGLDERLADMERALILEALRETRGVQAHAAKKLGMNERSLWYRIKKFGIDPDSVKP